MDLGRGSVTSLLSDMRTGLRDDVVPALHGHTSFARRMQNHSELHGHSGCVNRLALSNDGRLLLSGSDDCSLRLWSLDIPESVRPVGTVTPGHYANIFGVAFMPDTANSYVVSSGLDCEVRHTHVGTSRSTLWNCHTRQVKTVSPVDSNVFITASRDGTARLIDTRLPSALPVPIIAAISNGAHRFRPLSSAIPSPVYPNHLLVAGADPYMRVFDLRLPPSFSNPNHSANNSHQRPAVPPQQPRFSDSNTQCIEKYCPPHYHPGSPERLTSYPYFRIHSTFANFSPDGTQIVASYFEDTVTVFDRPVYGRHHHRAPLRLKASPFRATSHRASTVWKFTLQMAHFLRQQHLISAIASANRVLELDPDNVFALACKAVALLGRRHLGDFRTAFASLRHLLSLLDIDNSAIATLWGWTDITGTPHLPVCTGPLTDKLDMWRTIFHFLQMECLFRMIPHLDRGPEMPVSPYERPALLRRLEYLDRLCVQLEMHRQRCFPTFADDREAWASYVRRRALGSPKEVETLYGSECGATRRMILDSMVELFVSGLDARRGRLRNWINSIAPKDTSRDAVGSTEPTEAADSFGSASIDDADHNHGGLDEDGDEVDSDDSDDDDDDDDDNDDDDDDDDNDDDDDDDDDDDGGDGYIGAIAGMAHRTRSRFALDTAHPQASSSKLSKEEEEFNLWGPLSLLSNCRSFHGHKSEKTDIKEANFFGGRNQVILSGSDDGYVFMWSSTTGELLSHVKADEQIVNCVLPHPYHTMVIASGIDNTIKVLLPGPVET